MADPPTCKSCNRPHWSFKRCEQVEKRSAPMTHLSVPEGFRAWGDRLITLRRQGEAVFSSLERKTPFSVGQLSGPEGWRPPGVPDDQTRTGGGGKEQG